MLFAPRFKFVGVLTIHQDAEKSLKITVLDHRF